MTERGIYSAPRARPEPGGLKSALPYARPTRSPSRAERGIYSAPRARHPARRTEVRAPIRSSNTQPEAERSAEFIPPRARATPPGGLKSALQQVRATRVVSLDTPGAR